MDEQLAYLQDLPALPFPLHHRMSFERPDASSIDFVDRLRQWLSDNPNLIDEIEWDNGTDPNTGKITVTLQPHHCHGYTIKYCFDLVQQ